MQHTYTPAPATPPAAPLAKPCLRCRTTGGPRRAAHWTPDRDNGYCKDCAGLLRERVTRHGFATLAEADAALPYGDPQSHLTNPYDAKVRATVAHRRAQARVAARQQRFDAHAGAFLPAPPVVAFPLPWPREWGTPATDPLARAEWEAEERAVWSRYQGEQRAA